MSDVGLVLDILGPLVSELTLMSTCPAVGLPDQAWVLSVLMKLMHHLGLK